MTEIQRQQAGRSTMILLMTGGLCVLSGLFLFNYRLGFAQFFLGAHSFFGMPVTSGDGLKVLVVGLGSAVVVMMGVVIGVAGLVVYSKASAGQSGASPEAPAASGQR